MLNIRIESVKVNKKIEIDEENINFGLFEKEAHEIGLSVARCIMERFAEYLDIRLRDHRPKKEFENCGKAEKYLSTMMGDI